MADYDPQASGSEVPHFITFFNNGMAAVCNAAGEQIPKYQRGIHSTVIASLSADGYDWRALEAGGRPREPHEFCDSLGHPIPSEDYGDYLKDVARHRERAAS
jgi:hypothetical protein